MKCYNHDTAEAIGTCTVCGRAVCPECRGEVAGMLRCPSHGAATATVPAPPAWAPPPPPPAMADHGSHRKSPTLAFFLGLFPGAGHVYLGLYQRGVAVFGTWVLMIFMAANASEFFGFGVAFMVFFSILDAVRMARLINRGGIEEDPADVVAARLRPGTGSIALGVALILLGVAAWLNMRFGISFAFLADNWPLVLVVVGAFLVWRAVRARRGPDSPVIDPTGSSFAG